MPSVVSKALADTIGSRAALLYIMTGRMFGDCEARERVAAYKYPRLVVVVEELPRTPSGKILEREIDRGPLRAALAAESATRR